MPLKNVFADLNEEISSFTYDESFLPNELMWLLLALPVEDIYGKVSRLRINIPRTLVFGVRKDGILLHNDANGKIVHKFMNVDQCMTLLPFSSYGVVAHEREMSKSIDECNMLKCMSFIHHYSSHSALQ